MLNRPLNVLHLDDHRMIHISLKNILKKQYPELNFLNIPDGDTALRYVCKSVKNESPIDLVISDINHPGLNGLSFIKAIRRHEMGKKLPVLFFTMMNNDETVKMIEQIPYSIHLSKSAEEDEIIAAFSKLQY